MARDLPSVFHIKDQNAPLHHDNLFDLREECSFVKGLQPEHRRALLQQHIVREDAFCPAAARTLPGATDPVFVCGSMFPKIADVALATDAALDFPREARSVERLVRERAEFLAPRHFLLDVVERRFVDDGFVRVLDEVLRQLAAILAALFRDWVFDVFLLQKQVARVRDVPQDAGDVRIHPAAARPRRDALGGELALRLETRLAVEEVLENAPHDGGFLRHDDERVPFPAVAVDAETTVRDALLETLLHAPLDVFRNAAALLLRERRENREHQLALAAQRADIFLFKIDLDAERFQPPHGLEQVDRVAGEALDGFRQHEVDAPRFARREHFLERFALRRARPRDAVIGVHTGVLPFGMLLDAGAVVAHLRGKRVLHALRRDGDPRISRDAQALLDGRCRPLNALYHFHRASPRPIYHSAARNYQVNKSPVGG